MSKKSQDEITFDGLQAYLHQIGFEQSGKVNTSLVLCHRSTGTVVLLSIPHDGHTVRPADLLSIAMRLEAQGLAEDSILMQIKIGKLPIAS